MSANQFSVVNVRLLDVFRAVQLGDPETSPNIEVDRLARQIDVLRDVTVSPSGETVAVFGAVLAAVELERFCFDGAVRLLAALAELEDTDRAVYGWLCRTVDVAELRAGLAKRVSSTGCELQKT